MNPTKLLRSTAFRLVAAYFGLFSIASIVISAALYFQVSGDLEQHLKQRVKETHAQLAELEKNEGLDAFLNVVDHLSVGRRDPKTIAIFTDGSGKILVGDIQPMEHFSGWKVLKGSQIRFTRKNTKTDKDDNYYALWRPVAGGRLLIGHIDEDLEEAQDVILIGMVWSLGITLLVTLAGGAWLGFRAQARIQAIDTTLEAVARGKFDRRIPLTGHGDDLDKVSARINETFARIGALISSMRQISTDIAHDLKTPIGHLKQRLDTVRRSAKTVKQYRVALDEASGDIDAIVETFEALLRIAQIEAGARKARFARIDLGGVLENIAEAYEHVADDAGFTFAADLHTDQPAMIDGDPELLTQLFANVLENVFRHCPSGTDVKIDLRPGSDGPVVNISDTGPGIPADERENVLRRLYRLEKSRTTPGNGLGLSLVAAIADLHGAALELSDNQPGLCVSVIFPNVEDKPD